MTKTHSQIIDALAAFIAADADVLDYCVSNFGVACNVIVDAYGAKGYPGEEEAPYVFLFRDGDNEIGNVAAQTFDCQMVVGAYSQTAGASDKNVLQVRSAAQNGLIKNGILSQVEGLRDLIWNKILSADCFGAPIESGRLVESSFLDYPLQWANVSITFQEPSTLTD